MSELFIVEAILDRRPSRKSSKGRYEYLIKWKGWDVSSCTWEPQSNLTTIQSMVDLFNEGLRAEMCKQEAQETAKKCKVEPKQVMKKNKRTNQGNSSIGKPERKKKEKKRKDNEERDPIKMNEPSTSLTEFETRAKRLGKASVVKILGAKKEANQFWYYIEEDGIESWAIRDYVIGHYPNKLCEFYESKVIFNDTQ